VNELERKYRLVSPKFVKYILGYIGNFILPSVRSSLRRYVFYPAP